MQIAIGLAVFTACVLTDKAYLCKENTISDSAATNCTSCPIEQPHASYDHTFCLLKDTPTNYEIVNMQQNPSYLTFSRRNTTKIAAIEWSYKTKVALIHFNVMKEDPEVELEIYVSTKTGNPTMENHEYSVIGKTPLQLALSRPRPYGRNFGYEYQQFYFTIIPKNEDVQVIVDQLDFRGDTFALTPEHSIVKAKIDSGDNVQYNYFTLAVPNLKSSQTALISVTTENIILLGTSITLSYGQGLRYPTELVANHTAKGENKAVIEVKEETGTLFVGVEFNYVNLQEKAETLMVAQLNLF
jgi:hypothetical protein